MNRGILLGNTTDLAAVCCEVTTKRRATNRDMFAVPVSSVSKVKCRIQWKPVRLLPPDRSCRGEFALVLPWLIPAVGWVTRSKITLRVTWVGLIGFLLLDNV